MFDRIDLIAIFAGVLATSLIYYNLKKFSFWSSRGVKGPTPWPIFGTSIYYIFRDKIKVDLEWREKYGRYYGVYVGYKPELKICDRELVKLILVKEHSSFMDRNIQNNHEVSRRWLLSTKGKHWSTQRAILTPVFTVSKIRIMFKKLTICGQRFIEYTKTKLDSMNDKSTSGEGKLKISRDDFLSLTLDSVARSFFGWELDTYKDASSEFARRAFAFSKINFGHLIVWILTPGFIARWFQLDLISYSKYEYFDKLSIATIKDRRKNPTVKHNDILQAIMNAKLPDENEMILTEEDDIDAHFNDHMKHVELSKLCREQSRTASFRKFSDIELRGQMTSFVLAGFEASANTFTWCIYMLSHEKSLQQEIYEELLALCKNSNEISYDDLMNMVKLDAFMSEVMRLYSTSMDLNRVVSAKEGVILPTNPPIKLPYQTAILTSVLCIHRDPEYWPEPEKFDISRFYAGNKDSIKSCSYIPFGVGPRNCIGMKFALTQVKYFLAVTILNYRISYGPKSQAYPPKYARHFLLMKLADADFTFEKR